MEMASSRHLDGDRPWLARRNGRQSNNAPTLFFWPFSSKRFVVQREAGKRVSPKGSSQDAILQDLSCACDPSIHPSIRPISYYSPFMSACDPDPDSPQKDNRHSGGGGGPANTLTRGCICFTAHPRRDLVADTLLGTAHRRAPSFESECGEREAASTLFKIPSPAVFANFLCWSRRLALPSHYPSLFYPIHTTWSMAQTLHQPHTASAHGLDVPRLPLCYPKNEGWDEASTGGGELGGHR